MLRVDTRIDCNSDGYTVLRLGAVAAAVIWLFGVPLWWLVTLIRNKDAILRTGDDGEISIMAERFSFLVGRVSRVASTKN